MQIELSEDELTAISDSISTILHMIESRVIHPGDPELYAARKAEQESHRAFYTNLKHRIDAARTPALL